MPSGGIDYSKWDRLDLSEIDSDEEYDIPDQHNQYSSSEAGAERTSIAIPDDVSTAEETLLSMGVPYEKDANDGWLIVGPGKIRIHPDDGAVMHYSPVIFCDDPKTFVPNPDEYEGGRVTKWGMPDIDDEDDGPIPISFLQRLCSLNSQPFLYDKCAKPNEQFIQMLEKRKRDFLDSKEMEDLTGHTYRLKIELCENEKDVWRRIEVPANISLSKFHDQVLVPTMGWSRGYHGYVFQDPRDGTVAGPCKYDGYIDIMHAPMHFGKIMDDQAFPLAGMLRREGDVAYYIYDIGDQWEHRIILEKNVDAGEDSVSLIDGAGACPPEDGNGIEKKSNSGYAQFLQEYKKNPKKLKMKQAVKEASRNAVNYKSPWMGPPISFKPLHFDIAYHCNVLKVMLAGPSVKSRNGGQLCDKYDPAHYHESTRGCNHCGDRLKTLSKCTGCSKVSYCSRECQLEDWKRGGHKKECKGKKKTKKK